MHEDIGFATIIAEADRIWTQIYGGTMPEVTDIQETIQIAHCLQKAIDELSFS